MTNEMIVAYAFFINIISFIYMYIDKQRAKKRQWRISEKQLLFLAVCGGTIGMFTAMLLFRHKTKQPIFKVGIPVLFFIQIYIISYCQ